MDIKFRRDGLTPSEQAIVSDGFREHSEARGAPPYVKTPVSWIVRSEEEELVAILTADLLWNWVYIDELWVSPPSRGNGIGRQLIHLAEEFARSEGFQGAWLWTQSWQAESFYRQLGYSEFTRFDNFPEGFARIGFRKSLS